VAKPKSNTVAKKQVPKGFKEITGQGNFWKGKDKGDSITGKLKGTRTHTFPKKGRQEARDANVYLLETADGEIEVTQSGGLGALTKVKKGQTVYIEFVGMKKLQGKSPMREYIVGVK
jgi:hypothetical protein